MRGGRTEPNRWQFTWPPGQTRLTPGFAEKLASRANGRAGLRVASETAMTHSSNERLRSGTLGACRDVAGLIGLLRVARPNVLILGAESDTRRAIDDMRPHHETPIATWEADMPFRTLVVEEVDRLVTSQQQRLLHLLTAEPGGIQIVATSRHDVFEAVETGRFLDRLYYQLNAVLLDLRAVRASGDAVQSRAGSSFATT